MKKTSKVKEQKQSHSPAFYAQRRIDRLTKREGKLCGIVEKKKAHIAKLIKLLEKWNAKLVKVKTQKEMELKEIAQLAKMYQNVNGEAKPKEIEVTTQ